MVDNQKNRPLSNRGFEQVTEGYLFEQNICAIQLTCHAFVQSLKNIFFNILYMFETYRNTY